MGEPNAKPKLVELSSGTTVVEREFLEEKLQTYKTSLQIIRAKRIELLKEAEQMQTQIQAHLGAIQAMEELLRHLLPEFGNEEDPPAEED